MKSLSNLRNIRPELKRQLPKMLELQNQNEMERPQEAPNTYRWRIQQIWDYSGKPDKAAKLPYATQAGKTYTLSVDIKSLGGTTRYIEIYDGTENFNTGTPIASLQHGSGMGISTLEFTAQSSQTHITLRTVTGFSTVTFDDVTISESVSYDVAPETATEWFEDGLNGWSPLYSGTLPLDYNSSAESVTYQGPTTIGCGKVYTTETGKEYTVFVDILSLGGPDRFLEIYDGTGDFTSATPLASLQHGAAAETISLNFTAQSTQTHITMRTVSGFTSVNFDNVVLGEYVEGVRYTADVISSSDYYPYGMPMYGRNSNLDSYSYGFQGMELLNETNGNGNEYITEYRQYDPRLARWTSVDPLMSKFPSMSPYMSFNGNPIVFIDPDGQAASLSTIMCEIGQALSTAFGAISSAVGQVTNYVAENGGVSTMINHEAGLMASTNGINGVDFGNQFTRDQFSNSMGNRPPVRFKSTDESFNHNTDENVITLNPTEGNSTMFKDFVTDIGIFRIKEEMRDYLNSIKAQRTMGANTIQKKIQMVNNQIDITSEWELEAKGIEPGDIVNITVYYENDLDETAVEFFNEALEDRDIKRGTFNKTVDIREFRNNPSKGDINRIDVTITKGTNNKNVVQFRAVITTEGRIGGMGPKPISLGRAKSRATRKK